MTVVFGVAPKVPAANGPKVQAFSGTMLSNLSELTTPFSTCSLYVIVATDCVRFDATAGTTYFVRIAWLATPVSGNGSVDVRWMVANRAPAITSATAAAIDEGSAATIVVVAGDPDGDPLSYRVDCDGNGSLETVGLTCAASFFSDNGSRVLTVEVDDGRGRTASATAALIVRNVAPTATFVAPTQANAGATFVLSLNGAADPSSADLAAGFAYSFDCGAGFGIASSIPQASCIAATAGQTTVRGRIADKDGGVTEYSAILDVRVTFDGLCALTQSYSSKPGVANSLCVKLQAAQRAEARGDLNAKRGELSAYVNEVKAQSGKAFAPDAVQILIAAAGTV
jgi:hypothetical protein